MGLRSSRVGSKLGGRPGRILVRLLALAILPFILSGCMAFRLQDTDTVNTNRGVALLSFDPKTGSSYISIGGVIADLGPHGRLTSLGTAQFGGEQVIAVHGGTPECPNDYLLISIQSNQDISWAHPGNCKDELSFSKTARQVYSFQSNAADPLYWVYGDQKEYGPILKSVLFAPPPQKQDRRRRRSSPIMRRRSPGAPAPVDPPPTVDAEVDQPRTRHTEIREAHEAEASDEALVASGTEHKIPTVTFDSDHKM